MAKFYAATSPEMSEREIRNMNRVRALAPQGMVLLENKGALPLSKDVKKIAAFGNGIRRTVKGGTGSGDVNSRHVINLEDGLKQAGLELTSEAWLDRMDQEVTDRMNDYIAVIRKKMETEGRRAMFETLHNPFREPVAVPITEEDLLADADAAVYCIARNSGEGKDRKPEEGDFLLTSVEEDNIKKLISRYGSVIVLLNVGGVVDTRFLRHTEGVDALLLVSQAGNITGCAIADVITGKAYPSGHLTTTWAEQYEDYPCAETFSFMNGDLDDEYYTEDIYVGYRYFDSFFKTPAYPFGYGISYTTFDVSNEQVKADGTKVTVTADVTNTGDTFSGREVVQVYYSAPAGRIGKPFQELAAFAKTKELAPGESQTLSMTFDVTDMASYEELHACWILDPGTYYIRVGVNSRKTRVAAGLVLKNGVVTEQLKNILADPDGKFDILTNDNAIAWSYLGEEKEQEECERIELDDTLIQTVTHEYSAEAPEIKGTITDHVVTMDEVKAGKASMDDLVAQLTVEEMADLCIGTSRGGFGSESIIGAASAACPGAAGDTTSKLIESRNIRNMILPDGPAGLRLATSFAVDKDGNVIPGSESTSLGGVYDIIRGKLDPPVIPEDAVTYYQYATAIPIATLLAQSWDEKVVEEAGCIVGEEMKELGSQLWLAPGMNIHRNPLCGRNFEYYSEDPLVAGKCAAADTRGVQKNGGIGTTIKHFAFNNQEDNRAHVNSHVTERAAREIYLKGFEIAVKEAQPMSIMTSYNLVNGIHTANCYDIITTAARDEWGFKGIVMTDWGTTGHGPFMTETKYGSSSAAGCIMAGNDLTMPGSQKDFDEIVLSTGAKEGDEGVIYPLTLGQLQACAKRILTVIKDCSRYEE